MRTTTLAIAALLLAAPLPGRAEEGGKPSPPFAPGEMLHYKGYVFDWLPVGDVWFTVGKALYRGREVYRIDARALGHYVV